MSAPKRIAIYCRVSTRGQEEEGTSLASQEEACRRYAAMHGYTVAEEHVSHEVYTGTELWDRPWLTTLREAVRARQVDILVAYATDRLARDPIHLAILAEECERSRVALAFVTEPLDASPEGALIRYVKGYAARIEHEKIRERTLRGKRARAEAGQLHNHGSDLYGYRRDKETRTRSIDEAEAAVVRQIFRWCAEEGATLREVARRLNEAGTPPPSAGKLSFDDPERTPRWGKSMVQRLLKNPAYKGETIAWRYRSTKGRQSADRRTSGSGCPRASRQASWTPRCGRRPRTASTRTMVPPPATRPGPISSGATSSARSAAPGCTRPPSTTAGAAAPAVSTAADRATSPAAPVAASACPRTRSKPGPGTNSTRRSATRPSSGSRRARRARRGRTPPWRMTATRLDARSTG